MKTCSFDLDRIIFTVALEIRSALLIARTKESAIFTMTIALWLFKKILQFLKSKSIKNHFLYENKTLDATKSSIDFHVPMVSSF